MASKTLLLHQPTTRMESCLAAWTAARASCMVMGYYIYMMELWSYNIIYGCMPAFCFALFFNRHSRRSFLVHHPKHDAHHTHAPILFASRPHTLDRCVHQKVLVASTSLLWFAFIIVACYSLVSVYRCVRFHWGFITLDSSPQQLHLLAACRHLLMLSRKKTKKKRSLSLVTWRRSFMKRYDFLHGTSRYNWQCIILLK